MNFDQIIETLIKIASQNGTIKEEEITKYFEKGSEDYLEATNDLQSKGYEVILPSNPDDEDDFMDINDDDAWNDYLKELDKLGYDQWLFYSQIVYEETMAGQYN